MSQPSKELLSPAEVWETYHDHPTFKEFLEIHSAESPKSANETKDQYRLRVAQNFHDIILQPFLDEVKKIDDDAKVKGKRRWFYSLFTETIIDSENKDLVLWHRLMNIDFNTNCSKCGIVYGRADRLESKDGLKRYTLYMRNQTMPLSNELRSRIAAHISVLPNKLIGLRIEGQYQICLRCLLPEKIPSILSKQNVGVPSDVPTQPQAVYGVPPDVANIESVDWVKFLLMCLNPGSMLSIKQIHEILNVYAKITIDRAIYHSEKEEVYQARGLKEHLMTTGWPRMYCLKPDSYVAFRQQYDIRQIRKIVDRFIGPSRYKNEFIALE